MANLTNKLKVIIGLGNPGSEYDGTRHNAGFIMIDCLTKTEFYDEKFKKNDKLFCYSHLVNQFGMQILLAKPITYMNDSGKAFSAIKNWYKLEASDFLVIHDDVALPLGKLRFQKGGGAGGQHGVESIINCLGGDKNFDRLKIGIGPDPGGDKRADYVLEQFKKKRNYY